MQAGQQVLLCWLLLLWGQGRSSTGREGELCRAWRYGGEASGAQGAFQCPRLQDGPDATYCCGHCRLPFCCSRGEVRLDWRRCRRAFPNRASVTRSRRNTPLSTAKPFQSQIVVFCFISLLVGIALWIVLCRCKERCRQRRRVFWLSDRFNIWNRNSFNLEDLLPPLPPPPPPPSLLSFSDIPPPYVEDLPPYSVEDPQGSSPPTPPSSGVDFHCASAENQEDEVTLGPLVHRNVPSHSPETDSVRDTSEDQ